MQNQFLHDSQVKTTLKDANSWLNYLSLTVDHGSLQKRLFFLAVNNGNLSRNASRANRSDDGAATKIDVQSCSNSVFELK